MADINEADVIETALEWAAKFNVQATGGDRQMVARQKNGVGS